MPYCTVRWCGKRSTTSTCATDGITFHRYPIQPDTMKFWIDATRRENFIPTKNSVICSRHFTSDSFKSTKHNRRLIKSAIPTLYLPILTSPEITTVQSDPLSLTDHAEETSLNTETEIETLVIVKEELPGGEDDVMEPFDKMRNTKSPVSDGYALIPEDFMNKVLKSQNDILTTLQSQVLPNSDPELTKFLRFLGAALQRLPAARAQELQGRITEMDYAEGNTDIETLIIKEEIFEEEDDAMEPLDRKRHSEVDPLTVHATNNWNYQELEIRVKAPPTSTESPASVAHASISEVFMKKLVQSQNDILTTLNSQVLLNSDPELMTFLKFLGVALQRLPPARAKELQDQITEIIMKE